MIISTAVSRIRQPIESLFNWIDEKTGIQTASKARSTQGPLCCYCPLFLTPNSHDVYLLILGGHYGSIEPNTKKSYTQLEYEYAVSQGEPLFSCVIKDSAIESRIKEHGAACIETENSHKLREFRMQVLTKMVKFWEDDKDIKITIGETLAQLSRREDLLAWMRSQKESDISVVAYEITRLSKENAQLREHLSNNQSESTICGFTFIQLRKKSLLSFYSK